MRVPWEFGRSGEAAARPYIIAEVGVNHDGSVERALELTDAAAEAGADAIKLQLFETDRLLGAAARLAAYQAAAGETDPADMLRRLEMPLDAMGRVVERAHGRGIDAVVTVFSVELVSAADALPWDAYKTASPDIVNRPLLEGLVATGRPLIVSTGASTRDEVERAAGWLEGAEAGLAALHCVSAYPAPDNRAWLGAIEDMRSWLACPVGYSDHTQRVDTGACAAALGAVILEKHLTYDRAASGPDHASSLDPASFGEYVRLARSGAPPDAGAARLLYGERQKRVLDVEADVRDASRQSVTTRRAIDPGRTLSAADLTIKRPGWGVAPWRMGDVVGRRAAVRIEADTPVREEDLA